MVGFGLGLVSILIAATRSAMLGLIVSSIATAVYLRRYISAQMVVRTTMTLLMLIAVAALVVMSTDLGNVLEERLSTGLDTGDVQSISSGRTLIWLTALHEMMEYPLSFFTGFGW